MLKPEDTPNVIREEATLPKPEAADAGHSEPVRPARGVESAPEAATLEDFKHEPAEVSDKSDKKPYRYRYLPDFEIVITKDKYEICRDESSGWRQV